MKLRELYAVSLRVTPWRAAKGLETYANGLIARDYL